MALAAQYGIEIDQASAWSLSLTFNNPDGTPMNLTGFTARMQIRYQVTDPDPPVIDMTGSPHIVISGNAVTLALSAIETEVLIASAVYDFYLIPGGVSANAERIFYGAVTVNPTVTR